ncbi:transporter substrate-binding domain-containing protein [Uliginosibacterium sp. 31-16]|uniref:substrate-binding periplasmic protein n=1 Tax=Uliginosibacterium sp. 31-16 TaxID=3068315 RepID=UPI00273D488B|nr:transporter substrate-binding domain-containing protein [Uliginosibacterium sp. 31-16]MDP5238934.1 transporter substrate-binding domain-containing protein [Uliginosibacterium sp. 31-16]
MHALNGIFRVLILVLLVWPGRGAMAADGVVRLAALEFAPYIHDANGQAEGPVVDVVNEAFRRMGKPLRIGFFPVTRSLLMVEAGSVDGFFTVKKTPERERSLRFPREPLLSQDFVFFVRKDSHFRFNGDYASIANARIGVVNNMSYGGRFDAARRQGAFPHLENSHALTNIFRMLLAGHVDAMICSRLVGMQFIQELDPAGRIMISGPPSETTHSFIVFTRQYDTSALADGFDQAIRGMRQDGTLARLSERASLKTKP